MIPAVEILDWPDYPFRGMKEESSYGSNVMEKADWFDLIDDLASKKFNRVCISLYGCWVVQYDGKLIQWMNEQRKEIKDPENPLATVLSNRAVVRDRLSYYTYCYYIPHHEQRKLDAAVNSDLLFRQNRI